MIKRNPAKPNNKNQLREKKITKLKKEGVMKDAIHKVKKKIQLNQTLKTN